MRVLLTSSPTHGQVASQAGRRVALMSDIVQVSGIQGGKGMSMNVQPHPTFLSVPVTGCLVRETSPIP